MSLIKDDSYWSGLVDELCALGECEWIEFKANNHNPLEIGECISALANSAPLHSQAKAYMLWGIDDASRKVVGTSFDPKSVKKGNEPLINWLQYLTKPNLNFEFHTVATKGKVVVVLEIEPATHQPISFDGNEYIRIGQAKKSLKSAPEKESRLWQLFNTTPFESNVAKEQLSDDDVLGLLDYVVFFDLRDKQLPANKNKILEALEDDDLISVCPAGGWNITNLGAILLAKNLKDFPDLDYRTVRVIQYFGNGLSDDSREKEFFGGYATSFENINDYIDTILDRHESIEGAFRNGTITYPEIAIRELVANAIMHQDFNDSGKYVTIRIFENRLEIRNCGEPLIPTDRFLDKSPKPRNKKLTSLMRLLKIGEEEGGGIDKVIEGIEGLFLPAPTFQDTGGEIKTTLFPYKPHGKMSSLERANACYWHACLKQSIGEHLTNSSLRKRFDIEERNKSTATKYINEALDRELIKPLDPASSDKSKKYVPFWA